MTRRAAAGLGALVVATAGTIGLPIALAVPAAANQNNVQCVVSGVGPSGTSPSAAQTLGADLTVSGNSNNPNRYHALSIDLSIASTDKRPVPAPVHATGSAPSLHASLAVPAPGLVYNGQYTISASGTGHDDGFAGFDQGDCTDGPRTAVLVIAAPATAPKNVKATVDSSTRVVALTWTANPEPDVVGYLIRRHTKGESGGMQPVGFVEPPDHRFDDTSTAETDGGAFEYEVTAFRLGPTGEAGRNDPNALLFTSSTVNSASTATVPTSTTTAPTIPPSTRPGETLPPTTAGPSSGTTIKPVTPPKIDLKAFGATLDKGKAAPTTAPKPTEFDPGFQQTLPFRSTIPGDESEDGEGDPGSDQAVVGIDEGLREKPDHSTLAVFAGGLLLTAILMHLLWLRAQVKAAPPLEVIEADPAPPPGAADPFAPPSPRIDGGSGEAQ